MGNESDTNLQFMRPSSILLKRPVVHSKFEYRWWSTVLSTSAPKQTISLLYLLNGIFRIRASHFVSVRKQKYQRVLLTTSLFVSNLQILIVLLFVLIRNFFIPVRFSFLRILWVLIRDISQITCDFTGTKNHVDVSTFRICLLQFLETTWTM